MLKGSVDSGLKKVESATMMAQRTLKSTPLHEMIKPEKTWSSRSRPDVRAKSVNITRGNLLPVVI